MTETVFNVPFWFELIAIVTGAISGSMSASRARYDFFGTIIIGITMGLSGGMLRDVLLAGYDVHIFAFERPELIIACIVTSLVVFYFGRIVTYLGRVTFFIDALQVGMWSIIGANKALAVGVGPVPAVILGVITAIGGGILRDVLMNRPVSAFQPAVYFGTVVMYGTIVFVVMRYFHILDDFSGFICLAAIMAFIIAADRFGWSSKPSRDLSVPMADALAKPVRTIRYKNRTAENIADEAARKKRAEEHEASRFKIRK